MASAGINFPAEHIDVMTGEVTSVPGDEKAGHGIGPNERCYECIRKDEEIRRLRLENEELKKIVEQLKKTRGGVYQGSDHQSVITKDSFAGGESGDQNRDIGPVEESSDMSKRNDSSQMQSLLSPDSSTNKNQFDSSTSKNPPRAAEGINQKDKSEDKQSTSDGRSEPCCMDRGSAEAAGGGFEWELRNGCSLSELRSTPACHLQLNELTYDSSHTVLIDVNRFKKELVPAKGKHRWDRLFVRMPFAEENTLMKQSIGPLQRNEIRWEVIQKQLSRLAKASVVTPSDVETAIKKYNPKYKDVWSFDALHKFFEHVHSDEKKSASQTLSKIADLALNLPNSCQKAIPLLRQGHTRSITLSQGQIACLLANAFYCTFPHRNATHHHAEYANYPTINFHSLFGKWSERKGEKLRAIFHYFSVASNRDKIYSGLVTFTRCCLQYDIPQWKSKTEKLTKLHISSEGTIEENGRGMLQVDFACNLVGGGVLGSGLVQEEILFLINPELIVARLFTERLKENECLKVTGFQQYSKYFGYSDEFCWAGPHTDDTERDEWKRRHRHIVAMDALHFKYPGEQFNMKKVTRELNKAYCGFKGDENTPSDYFPAVATGNWGCGAFGGDAKLKALIQMMAAAVAQRDVAYFTFHDTHLKLQVLKMYHFLTTNNISVGRLYKALESYCSVLHSLHPAPELYDFIRANIKETTSRH